MGNDLRTNPYDIQLAGLNTSMDNKVVSYTPTWVGSVANPVINNGSLTGWYSKQGDFITAHISIIMGAGTTYGSGIYRLGIPVVSGRISMMGNWLAFDSSTGLIYTGASYSVAAGFNFMQMPINATTGYVTDVAPFAWGTGDVLYATITYPIR